MEPTFSALINSILSGGSSAIIALLLIILVGAFFVIKYLLAQVKDRDEKITKADERYLRLIQDYYTSNSTVTDALNGVKMVLIEIRSKL